MLFGSRGYIPLGLSDGGGVGGVSTTPTNTKNFSKKSEKKFQKKYYSYKQ